MNRKDFLKITSILGIGMPFVASCNSTKKLGASDKVIIIGAGAAGMSAGYLLKQQGIDFQILEASSSFGGRMACATSIANFPTPLGAEWVHTSANVFSEIVNDPAVDTSTPKLVGYKTTNLQDYYHNGTLESSPMGKSGAGEDRKFINSCWQEFFGEYIVPKIEENIKYNTPVTAIDYSSDQVAITAGKESYQAAKCIITVPLKMLQEKSINFTPALPTYKQKAISSLEVMPGFKCFLKTSQKFYNTYTLFKDTFIGGGQWIYYDAAYGQNTSDNILGFLCVGPQAANYPYHDKKQLLQSITTELKDIYGDDKVEILDFEYTNWDEVPYIKGSYLGIEAKPSAVAQLAKSIDHKLYFAGSAYTKQKQRGGTSIWGISENWSNVHAATRAAKRAVEEVLA